MNAAPNLQRHPLSAVFPAMTDAEFLSLKDSINNIGVQNPITLHENMVIDGWHRYIAANEVGLPCPYVELDDGVDQQDFAKSQACRRNLTAAQIAMAITAIYAWHPSHRKEGHTECEVKTNAQLAELAGVHANTISQAKAVQTNAVPEVQAAVLSGEIGLPKAAVIAKLSKSEQAAAIHKPLPKAKPASPMQDVVYREIPVEVEAEPDCVPDADELGAQEAAEVADRLAMQKLLDSDEKLVESFEVIKRLNLEVASLRIARDGAMNRANEAIQTVKKRDYQIKLLQQQLTAALVDHQTEDV